MTIKINRQRLAAATVVRAVCVTGVLSGLGMAASLVWAQSDDSQPSPAATTNKVMTKRVSGAQLIGLSNNEIVKQRFIQFLQNSPEILSARVNLQASSYGKDAAQSGFYPKVSVGANANSNSNPDLSNRKSTDITVRQPVYTGGRLTARMSQAEADMTIAKSTFDKTVQDSVLDALIAHNQLVRLDLLVEASRGAQFAVADLYQLEQRRVDLGGGGVTDAQFAKARLAVAQDRLSNFEGQLEEAKATYFRYFGAYSEGASVPELDMPANLLPGNVDKAVQQALFSNPQVKISELQIGRAKYNYEAEAASLLPSLEVVGVQQYYAEVDPYSGKKNNSSVNLRLAYNAFSGGEQTARVGQAASNIETQRALLSSSRLKTEENVRFQWGRRQAALARAASLDEATNEALQVFKNRKKLRDFGRETAIAMLDAQVEYFNVLISYLNAVFDARAASIRLVHGMGQLQPSDEPGQWFTQFFTAKSERAKLQNNLNITRDIARGRTDANSANDLGIKVDAQTVSRAVQFSLTPEATISRKPRNEPTTVKSSPEELKTGPVLKPSMEMTTKSY